MASYTVRCLPCVLHFRQSNNAFYRIPVFFKQNFFLSPRWKIKWPCFLFFCIYFSAKIFEFIFDPRCKIECALGHLDRVFLWWFFFNIKNLYEKKTYWVVVYIEHRIHFAAISSFIFADLSKRRKPNWWLL